VLCTTRRNCEPLCPPVCRDFGSFRHPCADPGLGVLTATALAQTRVQKLIDDLRDTSMPKGITKTNGRIEATQIDVAAKYAGRLATVTVLSMKAPPSRRSLARIRSSTTRRTCTSGQVQAGPGRASCPDRSAQEGYGLRQDEHGAGQPLVEKASRCSTSARPPRRVTRVALEAATAQHQRLLLETSPLGLMRY